MFIPNVYKLEPKIVEQLQIDMNACLQRLEFIKNNHQLLFLIYFQVKPTQCFFLSQTHKKNANEK
jgi:hypothetical protein